MKKALILLASTALLFGCASTSTNTFTAKRQIGQETPEKVLFFGAYKTVLAGTATWESEEECSEIKFVMQMRREGKADNLMDILMDEKCETFGPDKKCNCRYVGTALKYQPISTPEEAQAWNIALNSPSKEETKEEAEPAPVAPAPAPAPAPEPAFLPAAPAPTAPAEPTTQEATETFQTQQNLEGYPEHR